MTKEFKQSETIIKIEEYVNAPFSNGDQVGKNKVFYHYNEWMGWRFYLKALRHRDWHSIKGHILSNFGLR